MSPFDHFPDSFVNSHVNETLDYGRITGPLSKPGNTVINLKYTFVFICPPKSACRFRLHYWCQLYEIKL